MSISLHLDGALKAVVSFKFSEREALAGQSSRVERIVMGLRCGERHGLRVLFEPITIAAYGVLFFTTDHEIQSV